MKYFNNRFDFLRVNDGLTTETADMSAEDLEYYKDSLLPEGENVVNGSTCYYVDKGDLFIYYFINNGSTETGYWYNQTTYETYESGSNPYYVDDGGDDEPIQ